MCEGRPLEMARPNPRLGSRLEGPRIGPRVVISTSSLASAICRSRPRSPDRSVNFYYDVLLYYIICVFSLCFRILCYSFIIIVIVIVIAFGIIATRDEAPTRRRRPAPRLPLGPSRLLFSAGMARDRRVLVKDPPIEMPPGASARSFFLTASVL